MNKQMIVLAVAGALVASSAMADTVNVNVYGRIRAAGEYVTGSGAPAGKNGQKQIRVVDNSSVLGFKGTEDLGDGLLLLWQAEGQLEADGDSDGKLNSRNTFISLKNDSYGTVLVGKNDTPYKQTKKGVGASILEDSTAEISAVFGKYNGGSQNFYTRQSSTVQYISPVMSGIEFKIGFAPDEAKTATLNKTRVSSSLGYDNEMFYALFGVESRADAVAADKSAKAVMLNGGYKFGKNGSIGLGFEQVSSDTNDQENIYLTGNYKLAEKYTIGANIAKAGKAGSTANSGATMVSLGLNYDFSKRTSVTAYYAQIDNQTSANYNFGDNAIDQPVAGLTRRVAGLGINSKF